ncbi:hypothetical protein QFZ27_001727 [Inquilinus ginsengisoli]|uniref:hypothetical protein n=1 Tax=Inquilinus ginsengisoli TaxID=363840 RepID=UPI003D25C551
MPHVTLGGGLSPAGLRLAAGPAAVGNAIAAGQPRPTVLHKIALVRFHPVEMLWSRALSGP